MKDSGEGTGGLQRNAAAAIGSGLVAALVTNPLDVVKTRMQVEAASASAQKLAGNWTACNFYARLPVRSPHSGPSSSPFCDLQSVTKALGERIRSSSTATAKSLAHPAATWWEPHLAGTGAPGCECAEAVAAQATQEEAGRGATAAARSRMPAGCFARALTFQQQGMVATFKHIVQHEGVASLWRGLDSALMLTVPQVLLYYPLYDALMVQAHKRQQRLASRASGSTDCSTCSANPGYATPMLCGASARTVAVFAVAPLELARTRQQALHRPSPSSRPTSAAAGTNRDRTISHAHTSSSSRNMPARGPMEGAGGVQGPGIAYMHPHSQIHPHVQARALSQPVSLSTWGALRNGLGIDAAWGEGSRQGAGQTGAPGEKVPAATVVRSLPRLWTGFSATVARDVPFSALYWGLLEPIRTALLAHSSAPPSNSCPPREWDSCHQQASPCSGTTSFLSSMPSDGHNQGRSESELEWVMMDAAAGSMAPLAPWALGSTSKNCSAGSNDSCLQSGRLAGQDSNMSHAAVDSSGRPHLNYEGHFTGSSRDISSSISRPGFYGQQQEQVTEPSRSSLLWANFTAGSVSGAAAAVATTPFDVIKTRMQTVANTSNGKGDLRALSPLGVMKQVYEEGGAKGLFVGIGPRAARCAPACAIVVACYELFKSWL